jgi:hypothetical protein
MDIFRSKRVISLVLTSLIILVAKAQSDFRPGYIITLRDDTIHGLINFSGDKANAKSCVFKKEADFETVTYIPAEIKSYRFIDGKYYISSNLLNYKLDDHVFIEYVIKGSVSIYYYQDEVKDHYFVSKDTLIIELDHHERLSGSVEDDYLKDAKPENFKGQLRYLIQDQPSLFGKVNESACNTKDLISLTKQYQKLSCPSEDCLQYEKKTEKDVKVRFGMFVSSGISNLNVKDTREIDFKTNVTYEIGAVVNFYLNFIGENKYSVLLNPAINITSYSSNVESQSYTLPSFIDCNKIDVKFYALKIPLLFKYSFYSSNRSAIPYIKAGLECNIYLDQKGTHEYHTINLNNNVISPSYFQSLNKRSKHAYYCIIGGLGTDIKCGKRLFYIGAIYEYGFGTVYGHALGLGYMLNIYYSDAQLQLGFLF